MQDSQGLDLTYKNMKNFLYPTSESAFRRALKN